MQPPLAHSSASKERFGAVPQFSRERFGLLLGLRCRIFDRFIRARRRLSISVRRRSRLCWSVRNLLGMRRLWRRGGMRGRSRFRGSSRGSRRERAAGYIGPEVPPGRICTRPDVSMLFRKADGASCAHAGRERERERERFGKESEQ